MKLDKKANSNNDEFYTPKYAVTPIVEHLKKRQYKNIWSPFDMEHSLYVKVLRQEGFNVTPTHINDGKNFFDYGGLLSRDIPECDCIVSNPPYSLKTEVLTRLFEIGKPFAMLVGVAGLFESQKRFAMFRNNKFEILYLNLRVSYFQSYIEQTKSIPPSINPPFQSVYICSDVLPKQVCFAEINKKDTQ